MENNTKFSCDVCLKTHINKYSLQRHIVNSKLCELVRNLKKENDDYKSQINILTNQLDLNEFHKTDRKKLKYKLCDQLIPIKSEDILNAANLVTLNTLNNGPEEYANWMISFLKNSVICVDESRKKIVWKNEEKINTVNDIGCNYLLKKIFNKDVKEILYELLEKEKIKYSKDLSGKDIYLRAEAEFIVPRIMKKQDNLQCITDQTNFSKYVIKLFINRIKII